MIQISTDKIRANQFDLFDPCSINHQIEHGLNG